MQRFFLKEQVENKIRTSQGWPIQFAVVSHDRAGRPDYGALMTEDKYILSQLDDLIRRRIGGVIEIDHDTYQDWLKKKEETQSPNSLSGQSLPHLAFQPLSTHPSLQQNAAVASEPPPPLEVPKEFTKPKLGRPRKIVP